MCAAAPTPPWLRSIDGAVLSYSLFSLQIIDAECERCPLSVSSHAIPRRAGDKPITCLNLIGRRVASVRSELISMRSLADNR